LIARPRLAVGLALTLAAASLLLPYQPVYDPWAWLVWGRELLDGSLGTAAGPSWKPLPVLTCAPLSLLGAAAPEAWMLVARAGWICAPLLAGMLAARLSGPQTGRWRLAAALLAGASVALTGDAVTPPLRQFTGALSEPLLVSLVLGAIWAALDDRRGVALGLGAAAALLRPECWPFLALWCLWVGREPRLRPAAVAVALLVPAAWFVPDLLAAGTPLEGSETARAGGLEPVDAAEVLGRTAIAPLVGVWIGLALLLWRERPLERRLAVLLAAAAAWVVVVALMAVGGYAGLPRFLAPATAVLAVLGGVGLARAGASASVRGRAWSRYPRQSSTTRPDLALRGVVAVALVLAAGGFALRAGQVPSDLRTVSAQSASIEDLFRLADRLGPERLLACGGSVRVTQLLSQTALAWEIDRPIGAIGVNRRPRYGIALSTRPLPGGSPIARSGIWRATRMPCPSGYRQAAPASAQAPASSTRGAAIAGVSGAAR
jgi:hypothetical protein